MGPFGPKSQHTIVSERPHSRADSETGGFYGLSTTKSSGRRQQMDVRLSSLFSPSLLREIDCPNSLRRTIVGNADGLPRIEKLRLDIHSCAVHYPSCVVGVDCQVRYHGTITSSEQPSLTRNRTSSGFQPGLENGGPASLVWGMLLSMTGTMALALSLAEMASICPLAGAQYHWTAVLAPPRIRAFTTWMQGKNHDIRECVLVRTFCV